MVAKANKTIVIQCLNKTLHYCDNLRTNYTFPLFSGPVSVVLHFQVMHFQSTRQSVGPDTRTAVMVD